MAFPSGGIVIFFSALSICAATLPCKVTEKRTTLPIAGATVCIDSSAACTTVDAKGKGRILNLTPDTYGITAFAAGYDTVRLSNVLVKTGTNNELQIELARMQNIITLEKMVVIAPLTSNKRIEQTTSVTRLSAFDLAHTGGTANDVNRVIASLPSVIGSGDQMDNTFYVRGGQSRENLFLVDGIEIDNISHFSNIGGSGGALGYIDGSTVSGLDFYAGGMPALFPPAISSLIDMHLREGSYAEIKGKTELNIAGLGVLLEGPIVRDKISFLANVRYLDIASISRFLSLQGVPRFGDGMLKIAFQPNERNSFSLTSFGGYDLYRENVDTVDWPFPTDFRQEIYQTAAGMQWQYRSELFRNRLLASFRQRTEGDNEWVHRFMGPVTMFDEQWKLHPKFFGDTLLKFGDTLYHVKQQYMSKKLWSDSDQRQYGTLKDDAVVNLRDNDQFGSGIYAGITRYHLSHSLSRQTRYTLIWTPDSSQPSNLDSVVFIDTPYVADSAVCDTTAGGYAHYALSQGPLKVIAGVRADYFRLVRDLGVSPRVCGAARLPVGTIALSGGLYYQLPADFSSHLYDLMVTNPNYPHPKPPFWEISLQRNWQAALAFEKEFSDSRVLNVEAYGKWYDREYTLLDPGQYLYDKEFDDAIATGSPWRLRQPRGKKRVFGIECMFQKKQQKGLYYTVGGSFSSAKDRYANGIWYPDENDVRATLNATLGAQFLRHHTVSLRFSAAGGKPYSVLRLTSGGYFTYDSATGYNTKRLDPMVSANLRYGFVFFPSWGTITGYVEFWNLLNYQPVIIRTVEASGYRDFRANGIIPLAGIMVEF
jgi:hypothetical protein